MFLSSAGLHMEPKVILRHCIQVSISNFVEDEHLFWAKKVPDILLAVWKMLIDDNSLQLPNAVEETQHCI